MNDPQDTAIERVETEPPESADSDLSDEALDRPQQQIFPLTFTGHQ